MTKKIFGFISLIFFSAQGFASYAQHVKVCVDVTDNTSPFTFQAGFGSTDAFNKGNNTQTIFRGKTCASHTYSKGPKNLKVFVRAHDGEQIVLINPDASCAGFYNKESGVISTDYQKTDGPDQSWHFELSEAEHVGSYEFVFNLKCTH
jgi:hypothetical protein